MQKPEPNTIIISQKLTVDTFYCKADFETSEEWEEFKAMILSDSPEALAARIYDDADREDLWTALRNTKHKPKVRLTYNKGF